MIARPEDADYEGHSLSMLQRIAAALSHIPFAFPLEAAKVFFQVGAVFGIGNLRRVNSRFGKMMVPMMRIISSPMVGLCRSQHGAQVRMSSPVRVFHSSSRSRQKASVTTAATMMTASRASAAYIIARAQNPTHVCTGGAEAIQYLFETGKEPPALVLLDLKMPGVDGFHVLSKLKAHPVLRDIVVIVLTTSPDLMDISLAYELGANSFLTKPFDLGEFREMVTAFHKYWIVQNQPVPKRGKVIPKPPAEDEING